MVYEYKLAAVQVTCYKSLVVELFLLLSLPWQQHQQPVSSCYRSVLVAACEQSDLLMFDPHDGKLIGTKSAAHTDCVNCVRCVSASLLPLSVSTLSTTICCSELYWYWWYGDGAGSGDL